jgi:hypothetical protein
MKDAQLADFIEFAQLEGVVLMYSYDGDDSILVPQAKEPAGLLPPANGPMGLDSGSASCSGWSKASRR